jgi:23S rRNA pseudouridine1911/1915/1917 synthase
VSQARLGVDAAAAGTRLDLFVGQALGLSRAKVKALFDAGAVRVDGRLAKKGQVVTSGQLVQVEVAEPPAHGQAPQPQPELSLTVLHQDEALVFVDKPAGWPTHPLEPGETGTLANALVARFPQCATASEAPREGGVCHRLDLQTSGVVVAARTPEAWRAVRQQFTAHQVDKRYLALVRGPLDERGEIELPLRHRGERVEPALGAPDARPAHSEFEVLGRRGEHGLVRVRIITGVLHQVRAHLAAVGAPIVGDTLYGGLPEPGLSRFFLHAESVALAHPQTGHRLKVGSPLPAELWAALQAHRLAEALVAPTKP